MYRETKELTVPEIVKHPRLTQWRKRVDDAERRGGFTEEEVELAANWDTCAIGEARTISTKVLLKRVEANGMPPSDPVLSGMGLSFYVNGVSENCFAKCRDLLDHIESRLEQL